MKKKLLSVLICMTMSVGMLPTMAYAAEEGTEFEEQQVTIPEAPVATQIPMSYIVSCGEHDAETMPLNWDTLTIGDVTEEGGSYVCPITIATAAYAEAYSEKYGAHTATADSISFNMTWNGSEWEGPAMTQLPVINVVCEKEVAPEAPVATAIPTSYLVACADHEAAQMNLLPDTFTIGEVTKEGDSYVCPITIATAAYAEEYSKNYGAHIAAEDSITYNMTWNGTEWKAPEMTQLPVINVVCEKEVAPEAPVATAIPTSYLVACADHEAAQMNLLPDTFTIGEVTKEGDSYVCPITIATAAYAEEYSKNYGAHIAAEDSITYNMTWNGTEWKAPEMTQLPVINVVCEKEVAPEAPVATAIPTSYLVACADHEAAQMNLLPDTFTIGEVTKEGDSYVCPITIATAAYAEEYSKNYGAHIAAEDSITYNMTWNGTEWKAPEMTQLPVINVVCEKEVAPEAPVATAIPTSYLVACADHEAAQMNLLPDTFTIGEVTKEGDSYVCPITIATAAYAEAYSAENGKHTAVEESISFNMTWTGSEWKAPEMTQLPVINVACEKEVVPEAPVATAIPTSYIVSCEDHGAAQMNLLPDTFTIGEVTKDGDSYVCPITIATAAYAEAYSAENGKHTAVEESISFNMTWTGSEWKAPEMTQLPVINVVCEKEVVPAAPVESELAMGYMVKCKKSSFFHKARFIYQLPETVSIGEVEKKGDNYVCEISVSTKAYADAYSREFCKKHTAVKSNITYNMTWDGEQWKAPAYSNLPTIEVECARSFHFFPFVW
nr:hypothetical protein [uncultured Blautia sp.]